MAAIMQKAGDICDNCAKRQAHHKQKPNILQDVGVTQNHKIRLVACEYCDGEVIERHRALKKK